MKINKNNRLFEWDENKNEINRRKHGIDFRTAIRVFEDENRKEYLDDEHSDYEDRYKIYGMVNDILVVVYTRRGERNRIITARKARPQEWRKYYYGNGDIYFT